jgi:SOS-response transcriptional repressor LexA
MCDLLLIEPGKEVRNGDTVLIHLPEGFSIRKVVTKDDMIIFMDEKKEPIVSARETLSEGLKFYKISQCLRRL